MPDSQNSYQQDLIDPQREIAEGDIPAEATIEDLARILKESVDQGFVSGEEAISVIQSIAEILEPPEGTTEPQSEAKSGLETRWFTFGQNHVHNIRGFRLDKDIVLEITDPDPFDVMLDFFGTTWADQLNEIPDMEFYPRGIITLEKIKTQGDIDHVERVMFVD